MEEEILVTAGIVLGVGVIGYFLLQEIGGIVQPVAPTPQIGNVAAAIAKAEGSNPAWNNPGDLTISFGFATVGGPVNSAGVLQFATPQDGWNALYAQLSAIVNGQSRYTLDTSITDFGAGYSGGDPNWAVNVANALGVDPSTTLGEVLT